MVKGARATIAVSNNREIEIIGENSPSEAAYRETDATASSIEFSKNIISQKSKKSTPEVKKSKKIQPTYAGDKSKC